jgi:hypothetical protein
VGWGNGVESDGGMVMVVDWYGGSRVWFGEGEVKEMGGVFDWSMKYSFLLIKRKRV